MPPSIMESSTVTTAATTTTTASASRSTDGNPGDVDLLQLASAEIERIRHESTAPGYVRNFPPACLALLKHLEGNHRCVDCGEQNPQWATYRYGALLCLKCSGQHRSMGVQVSSVRSITMDEWSVPEIISMLEGGNAQITAFFQRHNLTRESLPEKSKTMNEENVTQLRYKTKAALFYRRQMEKHVETVLKAGPYRGREISRRLRPPEKQHSNVS